MPCCMAVQEDHNSGNSAGNAGTTLDEQSIPCCTYFTAGGFNTAPSIHEIPQLPDNHEKILAVAPSVPDICTTSHFPSPESGITNYSDIFLLSGEKCALTSVFLI